MPAKKAPTAVMSKALRDKMAEAMYEACVQHHGLQNLVNNQAAKLLGLKPNKKGYFSTKQMDALQDMVIKLLAIAAREAFYMDTPAPPQVTVKPVKDEKPKRKVTFYDSGQRVEFLNEETGRKRKGVVVSFAYHPRTYEIQSGRELCHVGEEHVTGLPGSRKRTETY